MTMAESDLDTLTLIQYDIPPLKAGEYTVTATQTVNQPSPNNRFSASRKFAVPGNRFQLNGDDIVSVFPAPLANGEFTGDMPLVVLRRETLPWQRTSVATDKTAPWLALLLFDETEMLDVKPVAPIAPDSVTNASYLFSAGGKMPNRTTSYPGIDKLDPGQAPTDPCTMIDVPVALFSKVCPSPADLPFLAHVRLTDTYDSVDNRRLVEEWAVILGNRWPKPNTNVYAFLVSLENMGERLPNDDGSPSPNWPPDTTTVRLICLRTWRFFANNLGEKFQSLCERLTPPADDPQGVSSLRLPAKRPDPAAVATALAHQATGDLTDGDCDELAGDALCMGLTALNHHLRMTGHTVSWYRGPLIPYAAQPFNYTIAPCPDALVRYDPQTGMFDATYAHAWQLGQLLALESTNFSVALYNWKHSLQKGIAAQKEMAQFMKKLEADEILTTFFAARTQALKDPPPVPKEIADWIGRLKLLKGVPFAALVPDERMLPVESLRFFYLDLDWTAALVDGAFSIGRAGTTGTARDAAPLARANAASQVSARRERRNHRPHLAARLAAAKDADFEVVTGCLIRSQIVSGWPGLIVSGYSDHDGVNELPKLRMERLTDNVLICLFEGAIQSLTIGEASEQLHCGVEGNSASGFTTALRQVGGDTPGRQYETDPKGGPPTVAVSVRSDQQTIRAKATADDIRTKLNSDFGQNLPALTSAEFALEMVKGVVKVMFQIKEAGHA